MKLISSIFQPSPLAADPSSSVELLESDFSLLTAQSFHLQNTSYGQRRVAESAQHEAKAIRSRAQTPLTAFLWDQWKRDLGAGWEASPH